jgi:SAM-dependent methyltransferase
MSGLPAEFLEAYARHRAAEGRSLDDAALRQLPYLRKGPLARHWAVRARTFEAFMRHIVAPMTKRRGRPLRLLDLGAGNGWLSNRLCAMGHRATALDVRDDMVDGLGAAARLARDWPDRMECITASFEALPLKSGSVDIAAFNASLHYARDLSLALSEATRVTAHGGAIAILDSSFYSRDADGKAMVAEKTVTAHAHFGRDAGVLLQQGFIEYLTPARLANATPSLSWRRKRVHYPFWYEMRPLMARLKNARTPSRFDLWVADLP